MVEIVGINSVGISNFEGILQGGTYLGDCRNLSMRYP